MMRHTASLQFNMCLFNECPPVSRDYILRHSYGNSTGTSQLSSLPTHLPSLPPPQPQPPWGGRQGTDTADTGLLSPERQDESQLCTAELPTKTRTRWKTINPPSPRPLLRRHNRSSAKKVQMHPANQNAARKVILVKWNSFSLFCFTTTTTTNQPTPPPPNSATTTTTHHHHQDRNKHVIQPLYTAGSASYSSGFPSVRLP